MRISLLTDLGGVEGEDQGDAKDTAHRTLIVSGGEGQGCGEDGSLQKSTRDESFRHLWDNKKNPHVCQACGSLICMTAYLYSHTWDNSTSIFMSGMVCDLPAKSSCRKGFSPPMAP